MSRQPPAPENGPSDPLSRSLAYPAIDGLRFYAAFLVFLVHFIGSVATSYLGIPEAEFTYANPNSWVLLAVYLGDGNHGVDLFFLISGFLMVRIAQDRTRPVSPGRFIANRFRRIYPAFLASLLVALLVNCLVFSWPFKPVDLLLNLVFYNAWPDSRVLAYHSVSWSLGYEFAFYLAVPVVALLTRRFDARLVGIGLFAAVSLALPDPFLRMNGLFLGALIGCFTDASLRRAVTNVPMELCLLLYLSISVAKGFLHLKFATYLWLFLPVSALLFCKIVFDGGQLGRALSASPLRRLGTVSYSFYLYHTTIISLMLHVVLPKLGVYMHRPVYVPMLFVFSLLASILAAKLSYRLFEQPYFRRKP